ncbi:PNPO [Bugula neritina]|uniref:pyridoxal 5'-phosphate synthase n=1 Tax=Bugula neritina TaxID=10212 RepID=A0A7J7KST4_BUGNE|nr:PNPO [Bugula neritina]
MNLMRNLLIRTKTFAKTLSTAGKMDDMSAFRISYNPKEPMDIDNLPSKDPMELFDLWFKEISSSEEVREPNAMTLATCNRKCEPSARMVLLKGYDSAGFRFFTDYDGRKGQELAENSNVALVLYWRPFHRQVRVEGTTEKLSPEECDQYFHSRPHGSQLAASASNQSTILPSYQVLIDKYAQLQEQYPTDSDVVPRPQNWGGYLVKPKAIEFWEGHTNRLHRRLLFSREKPEDEHVKAGLNGWHYCVLSP